MYSSYSVLHKTVVHCVVDFDSFVQNFVCTVMWFVTLHLVCVMQNEFWSVQDYCKVAKSISERKFQLLLSCLQGSQVHFISCCHIDGTVQ